MDIFSHLNWYSGIINEEGDPIKEIPTGKLILISDTLEAEGSFLIHHFLQTIFKINNNKNLSTTTNNGICLLGLNQSLYHYSNIGRKLGYNLVNENSKGSFTFINALSTPYQWIKDQRVAQLEELGLDEEPKLDSVSQGFNPFPIVQLSNTIITNFSYNTSGTDNKLEPFLQRIYTEFVNDHKKRIASNPKSKTLFIIDNLNLLMGGCTNDISKIQILQFLQYCNTYVKEHQDQCSMVYIYHSDIDQDNDSFFKQLQYESSDVTLNITGLNTGYSKDIDGQINFLIRDPDNNTLNRINPIHYQVLENNIRFFSMGSRIQ
eukprot:gene8015-9860_t